MENVIHPRYLPENEPSKSLFEQYGILTLPNKNSYLFRSCQRKNKKATKGFNMTLIQIFYILLCYIFRPLNKVRHNATLILIETKCHFKCRLENCFLIHVVYFLLSKKDSYSSCKQFWG